MTNSTVLDRAPCHQSLYLPVDPVQLFFGHRISFILVLFNVAGNIRHFSGLRCLSGWKREGCFPRRRQGVLFGLARVANIQHSDRLMHADKMCA